jgi:flavoprotein
MNIDSRIFENKIHKILKNIDHGNERRGESKVQRYVRKKNREMSTKICETQEQKQTNSLKFMMCRNCGEVKDKCEKQAVKMQVFL